MEITLKQTVSKNRNTTVPSENFINSIQVKINSIGIFNIE